MKVVFMGSPEFALPTLEALVESEEVCAVFSQPDRPRGRGYNLLPTPVKEYATQCGIPVYTPSKLRISDDRLAIYDMQPDVIIVVAYGQILPPEVLEIPPYGCINVHASLLPKYRGAAPIHWALLNGDKKTGVTTMLMDETLDTGDMLYKAETPIDINDTFSTLHDRLAVMGADVLMHTLNEIKQGRLSRAEQDDVLSTYAPMIEKSMSELNFDYDAVSLHNIIRAIGGKAVFRDKNCKIYVSRISERSYNGKDHGEIVISSGELEVVCGSDTALVIEDLALEGGKRLSGQDFINGYLRDTIEFAHKRMYFR